MSKKVLLTSVEQRSDGGSWVDSWGKRGLDKRNTDYKVSVIEKEILLDEVRNSS